MSWRDSLSSMAQGVKDFGTGVLGKATAMKDATVGAMKTAGGVIKSGVTGAMNVVKDSAGVIGNIAKEHAGSIGQVLGGAAGALVGGPAGAALGQRLGSMAGGWVQGGGLEKTKVGQAVTGLAKSVASGDGQWKQHLGNVGMFAASKLTSRVAKHYVGGDIVKRVKVMARQRGGGGQLALPAPSQHHRRHHSAVGASSGGGPSSNVYNGGGVKARPSAPAMTSGSASREERY
jgi:hypothetical protein